MSGQQQLILGTGAGGGGAPNYIEDVFSTWLYTGNGANRSINNGIDLSTKGGLVWIKDRSAVASNALYDTARGANNLLISNSTNAQNAQTDSLTAFNSNGFSLGTDGSTLVNASGDLFASWTFRKQAKFFDIVTWSGDDVNGRQIPHSLGSVPGCIIVKSTAGATTNWNVSHRGNGSDLYLTLNSSGAATSNNTFQGFAPINGGGATSTFFYVYEGSSGITNVNLSGVTYVAYLFAHDAGGFGLTGTDNVISCGSFTTDGSGNVTVNLGYEPQWLLYKTSAVSQEWNIVDTMRGYSLTSTMKLEPNTSGAEYQAFDSTYQFYPTATGFQSVAGFAGSPNTAYIYIAIRRGPMRTPTTGTSVFTPLLYTGNNTNNRSLGGFGNRPDTAFLVDRNRDGYSSSPWVQDRLRGPSRFIATNSTASEANASSGLAQLWNDNVIFGSTAGANWNSSTFLSDGEIWAFTRAPGFFDEVCYTGTGSATSFTHNLGAVPQLMIVKGRSSLSSWHIYDATNGATNYMRFNNDPSTALSTIWNNTAPTSTQFTVGTSVGTNSSGGTYVAYLFATVAAVSRVGSYTGTGALQTVNCGFTGGARFVLIKRTDAGGDWWVYDSARGISSGNDPYIFLNTSDPEVTGTNYVDTTGVGFQVTAAAPAGLNANGGTYIFLAIA